MQAPTEHDWPSFVTLLVEDDRDSRKAAAKSADEAAASAMLGGSPSFRLAMLEMAARMRKVLERGQAKQPTDEPPQD